MSRKRIDNNVGSLELLLDTICNTFGGILLISLLVAILISSKSRTIESTVPSQQAQIALQATENERGLALRELERLREAVMSRREVESTLLPADVLAEARGIQRLRQEHARLVTTKSEVVGDASVVQMRTNSLYQDAAERTARLQQSRKEANEVAAKLEATVAARTREISIPRLQEATTSGRAYFVVDGRLFGPWQLGPFGRETNDADFNRVERNGTSYLEPRSGAGVKIPEQVGDAESIAERLSQIDKLTEHAKVFVWPDSYGVFNVVREAITGQGIKLELIPMPEGESVSIGSAPFAPSLVQ